MNDAQWSLALPLLPPGFRYLLPVLPLGGHRMPMREDADLTMPGMVGIVADFLDALDLTDVTLVVSDWGGPLFLTDTGRDKRVARMVLCPSEAFDNFPPGFPGKLAWLASRNTLTVSLAMRQLKIGWLRRQWFIFGQMAKNPVPQHIVDEWLAAGIFARLKTIALDSYDRIVGLLLDDIAVDGCITKAPGGGEVAGPSPVDRRKQGMKRSLLVEGYGIPLGRVLAGANRHDSPLLAPTLDRLGELGPLPEQITVHLDSGYDSGKTRDLLTDRGLHGKIAVKGLKAPVQASGRWHVERTNSWHNAFNKLQRCYERRERVIDAFFDLADAVITVRALIRRAWATHRWDTRPAHRR